MAEQPNRPSATHPRPQSSSPAASDGPVEPMTQLAVKLARRFAFDSLAIAEPLDPAFNFGASMRSAGQMLDEHLQMSQLLLDQVFGGQGLRRLLNCSVASKASRCILRLGFMISCRRPID